MTASNRPDFPISPTAVRYIKLGRGGCWEQDCIAEGKVRIGFGSARPERFSLCIERRWDTLLQTFLTEGKNKGTASRFTNEVRSFFEDDGSTLWLTFVGNRLYWCFLNEAPPTPHQVGFSVLRTTENGWSSQDANGDDLSMERLSGALTRLAAYRGTSCRVRAADYAVRRINGVKVPQVERALATFEETKAAALGLIRLLTWKDFETLADLIFSASGWRRQGVVGKSQRMLDLDVTLPSTGERALVQIKSQTTQGELDDYIAQFDADGSFDKLIYVYHTGKVTADERDDVLVMGPEKVAELALDAGLMRWLIEKAS